MAQSTDFYAVLGVARTADEREIKKAYFRLVRQYSPETHPEEFKRLREAYEVLGKAESRKEYDNVTQYGEEIGAHLRAGMEAMDRGDLRQAQAEFKHVLTLQPELHYARDLLGMSFLNNNQPREALSQFNMLLSAEEGNATYHLHRGYAHYALDQHNEALTAYDRARELDQADTRVLVAMADCYTAMDRYDDALRELDRAIHLDGEVDFQDYVFFMRKVQIQLLRDRADLAEQEIDQLCRVLPDDAEVRKQVAQKLGALAAQLFRIKRSADGNRLLRRARQIELGDSEAAGQPGKARRAPLSFPARVVRRLRDLPRATQERLEQLAKEPAPQKLVHGLWAGPVLLALLAAAVLGGGVFEALTERREWHGNGFVFMMAVLALGPVLALLAGQRLLRAARSKVGRYTTIHPLYLLQVDVDRVTAWPLVNLHDVSMTHHLQNGVYQYTAVKADFAGVALTLTIRGQQAAVDWAQALLDARHRCLGLLSVGMLEEEDGADLLPPPVLERPAPPADPALRRTLALRYGAAALLGAGLATSGAGLNARSADEAAWRTAQLGGRAFGYRHYLGRYEKGRHSTEARARLAEIYDEAKERYLKQVGDVPGKQAMLDVLDALKEAPTQEVWVRYAPSVDMSSVRGQRLPDGTLPIQPDRAFTESVNRQREAAITGSLASAFQRVLAEDVLSLTSSPGADDAARYHRRGFLRARPQPQVIFDVSYRVKPSGELYRSTTDKSALYGIELDWTLKIKTPRSKEPYTVELVSQPAQSIRYVRSSYEDDEILPYTKMAESAFEEFGRKVAREFGVTIATPRPRSTHELSPEARRILQDLARRKSFSPTALEEMERLLRARPPVEAEPGEGAEGEERR